MVNQLGQWEETKGATLTVKHYPESGGNEIPAHLPLFISYLRGSLFIGGFFTRWSYAALWKVVRKHEWKEETRKKKEKKKKNK